MAEFVMKSMTSDYHVESRATSSWEHGNPIHRGTQGIFQQYQIPYDKDKTSLQIGREDFESFDYIIGMDASKRFQICVKCVLRNCSIRSTLLHLEVFQILGIQEIFEETYARITSGCQSWLDRLEKESDNGKA